MFARQKLSRQRVGLASPDNSDTHNGNAGRGRRGRCGSGGGVTSYTSAASVGTGVTGYTVAASVQDWRLRVAAQVEDRSRQSYRLHIGVSGEGLETSRGGAG